MTFSSTPLPRAAANSPDFAYRVMVVDDSLLIRRITASALSSDPSLKVVTTAINGQQAIDFLKREAVDVIVLDIEMPVMDGLTALPQLKKIDAGVQIVMSSTLTQKNAEISLQAMSLGAADYVPKPTAAQELSADAFKRELIDKVKALGAAARRSGVRMPSATQVAKAEPRTAAVLKTVTLRREPILRPDVIAIGSSTGGPQALFTTIKAMGADLLQPVVVTQHMPPAFTTTLADHIARHCKVTCTEAKEGDVLKPGHYYIAPGDYHMLLIKSGIQTIVKLTKDAQENFCRPAVDPMLRSLIPIYGKRILVMILTGMGQDGCSGSDAVVKAGGSVIAQNEASSVVWGMPGAVANAGLCSAVLPIEEIGSFARQISLKAGA